MTLSDKFKLFFRA